MLRIILLLGSATGTLAQVTSMSSCPSATVVTDFDAQKFAGNWYEAERYFALFQMGATCSTVNYSPNDNGTITARVDAINPRLNIEAPITGLVTPCGDMSVAKFTVTYGSPPILVDTPYWLIGTDYDNWAVFWSCTDLDSYSSRLAWLLTRERNPSLETLEAAYAVFDANKISRHFLLKSDQTNC